MDITDPLHPSSDPGTEDQTNQNMRLRFTLLFQQAVDAGDAQWQMNDDGDMELHYYSGEIFLLQAGSVKRLR